MSSGVAVSLSPLQCLRASVMVSRWPDWCHDPKLWASRSQFSAQWTPAPLPSRRQLCTFYASKSSSSAELGSEWLKVPKSTEKSAQICKKERKFNELLQATVNFALSLLPFLPRLLVTLLVHLFLSNEMSDGAMLLPSTTFLGEKAILLVCPTR